MKTYTTVLLIIFSFASIIAQDSSIIKEGVKAPNFSLVDQTGKVIKLSSLIGKSPIVIYFYPKAGTPGCTKQACGIRDDIMLFKQSNIVVLGISVDSKEEIKKFVEENNLNFPLLSDYNKKVSKKYGVLREDGLAKRVTFIIDRQGKISKIINVMDIAEHATEVYKIATQL